MKKTQEMSREPQSKQKPVQQSEGYSRQSEVRRSSSTLGELLSIAEVMKEGTENLTISSRRSYGGERDQKASTACLSIGGMREGCSENPLQNLTRNAKSGKSSTEALSWSPPIGSISRALVQENPLDAEEMEHGFQPNGTVQDSGKWNAVVLYFTSLGCIRKTYDDCCSVKAMLREYCVRIDERDVSMHVGFKEELRGMTRDGNCTLPRVFLDGRDLGGAEELKRMHENDELAKVFEGCDLEAAPFEDDASNSICLSSTEALSWSPIGSISRTLTRENPLDAEMEHGFQPNGTVQDSGKWNAVVLYFTSLGCIRKTYDDCCSVKAMLREYCVRIDERDVSMHGGFKEELKGMTRDGNCTLPRVFLDGRDLGGAGELKRMHENDELAKVFEGCAKDSRELGETGDECDVCGDVRFVMCGHCSGSCRVYDDDDEEIAGGGGWQRCSNCNEFGIVRCPVCC